VEGGVAAQHPVVPDLIGDRAFLSAIEEDALARLKAGLTVGVGAGDPRLLALSRLRERVG